ncbi:RNA-binding protein 48 [Pararge aegeria]|uniref:RNA-binding protein 48 n=2 Tax=Pararge aegeria TaxID=116150 RepID=A0A8S4S3G1_9NEOP|nr:RNA-binding protein 48 [Pararge aegeria]CAH2248690.1 jg4391 [Pararge aegeria aegeria]
MQEQNNENEILLPHHEQQSLCTTRLPYRQGRKLTAVKVYSICKESNHLLIFGVPSLNLRQEIKALFIKFGKLLQFNISKEHAAESFTETYHAQYERIQSARHAKRMLDTKNFYGGLLHVCYAPELEDINETRQKLMQRQRDVIFRLKNLNDEQKNPITASSTTEIPTIDVLNNEKATSENMNAIKLVKLNMGDINTIYNGTKVKSFSKKRTLNNKIFQPCFVDNKVRKTHDSNISSDNISGNNDVTISNSEVKCGQEYNVAIGNISGGNTSGLTENNIKNSNQNIEVIDCTGVDDEVVTNINECLNYNNFGSEVIRKIPKKPVNKIQFHINKQS